VFCRTAGPGPETGRAGYKQDLRELEFDGKNDSLFHSYDAEGRKHMEYIRYRGEYADVPLEEIIETFRQQYPNLNYLTGSERDAFTENR
jgi:hypothetical protein